MSLPIRNDLIGLQAYGAPQIDVPVREQLIVELYSK